MEQITKEVSVHLASAIELGAAIIVGYATVQALYRYFLSLKKSLSFTPQQEIRLTFGSHLGLALEFLLGADILRTAVAPSWNDIGQLAAIAVLRTGLNYFLERELKREEVNPEKETQLHSFVNKA
jgi:uncharacterized membrane protein